jgi:hypothetical protein
MELFLTLFLTNGHVQNVVEIEEVCSISSVHNKWKFVGLTEGYSQTKYYMIL